LCASGNWSLCRSKRGVIGGHNGEVEGCINIPCSSLDRIASIKEVLVIVGRLSDTLQFCGADKEGADRVVAGGWHFENIVVRETQAHTIEQNQGPTSRRAGVHAEGGDAGGRTLSIKLERGRASSGRQTRAGLGGCVHTPAAETPQAGNAIGGGEAAALDA